MLAKATRGLPSPETKNPRDMIPPEGSPPNDRRLDCKFCGKIFKSHNYVKVHEAWHRGELKHKCTHCGRDFRFPSELKKHISIHTGEKPYKCDRCGEGFNKVHSLNIHIKNDHEGEGKPVSDDPQKIQLTILPYENNKEVDRIKYDAMREQYENMQQQISLLKEQINTGISPPQISPGQLTNTQEMSFNVMKQRMGSGGPISPNQISPLGENGFNETYHSNDSRSPTPVSPVPMMGGLENYDDLYGRVFDKMDQPEPVRPMNIKAEAMEDDLDKMWQNEVKYSQILNNPSFYPNLNSDNNSSLNPNPKTSLSLYPTGKDDNFEAFEQFNFDSLGSSMGMNPQAPLQPYFQSQQEDRQFYQPEMSTFQPNFATFQPKTSPPNAQSSPENSSNHDHNYPNPILGAGSPESYVGSPQLTQGSPQPNLNNAQRSPPTTQSLHSLQSSQSSMLTQSDLKRSPNSLPFQPDFSSLQPDESVLQPNFSSLHPNLQTLQPNLNTLQPNMSSIQPNLSSLQPNLSSLQPNLSTLQPNLSTLQPNLSTLQPNVSSLQPNLSALQPNLSQLQPVSSNSKTSDFNQVYNFLPRSVNSLEQNTGAAGRRDGQKETTNQWDMGNLVFVDGSGQQQICKISPEPENTQRVSVIARTSEHSPPLGSKKAPRKRTVITDEDWIEGDPTLPKGWLIRIHERQTKRISGRKQQDIYYKAPNGKRIGSRGAVIDYLVENGAPEEDIALVKSGFNNYKAKMNKKNFVPPGPPEKPKVNPNFERLQPIAKPVKSNPIDDKMSLHEFLNFGTEEPAPPTVSLNLGIDMPQQTQGLDLGIIGNLDLGIEITPLDVGISGASDIQELDLGMLPQISIQSPSNETTNISYTIPGMAPATFLPETSGVSSPSPEVNSMSSHIPISSPQMSTASPQMSTSPHHMTVQISMPSPQLSSTSPQMSSTSPEMSTTPPLTLTTSPHNSSTSPQLSMAYSSPQASYASPQMSYTSPQMSYTSPQMSYTVPQVTSNSPPMSAASPTMPTNSPAMPTNSPNSAPVPSSQNSQISPRMSGHSPQMPDISSQMPDISSQMPDISTQIPDVSPQMPGVSSQMPDVSSQMQGVSPKMSGVSSKMPGASSQMPDISSQIHNVSSQVPGVSAQMPDVSSKIPDVSSKMPDAFSKTSDVSSQTPGVSSQMPGVSSQIPVVSSQMPGVSSQMPGVSSQMPGVSSQMPGVSSKMPEASSEMPDISSLMSNIPAQMPNISTQMPVNSTQASDNYPQIHIKEDPSHLIEHSYQLPAPPSQNAPEMPDFSFVDELYAATELPSLSDTLPQLELSSSSQDLSLSAYFPGSQAGWMSDPTSANDITFPTSGAHRPTEAGQLDQNWMKLEGLDSYDISASDTDIFDNFMIPDVKNENINTKDWITGDKTVPIGWKICTEDLSLFGQSNIQTHLLSPDGRYFNSRAKALEFMILNNQDAESMRIMRDGASVSTVAKPIPEKVWKRDKSVPEGWNISIEPCVLFGKVKNKTSFLAPTGQFFPSRKAAVDFMKQSGSYSSEDIAHMSKDLDKKNKNVWSDTEERLPQGWRVSELLNTTNFQLPGGRVLRGRHSALIHMINNPTNYTQEEVDSMRNSLTKEGWNEDKNLPFQWRYKTFVTKYEAVQKTVCMFISPKGIVFRSKKKIRLNNDPSLGLSQEDKAKIQAFQPDLPDQPPTKIIEPGDDWEYDLEFLPPGWRKKKFQFYCKKLQRMKSYCNYLSPDNLAFRSKKAVLEFMEAKGTYSEEEKEKFCMIVKKGGIIKTTTRATEASWKEGDPTLPAGWKIRNNHWGNIDRQTFLAPCGKFFMSRKGVMSFMEQQGTYQPWEFNKVRSGLKFKRKEKIENGEDEDWKLGDPTLPDGWRIKAHHWNSQERQSFMSPCGEVFMSRKGVMVFMTESGTYSEQDFEKVRSGLKFYKKDNHVFVPDLGVDGQLGEWQEGDATVPEGWKVKNNFWGGKWKQTFLSPAGEIFTSRKGVMEYMVKENSYTDEDFEAVKSGLKYTGRPRGDDTLTVEDKLAKYAKQRYENSLETEEDDATLPANWKKRSINGLSYFKAPSGEVFNTRKAVLQYMEKNEYSEEDFDKVISGSKKPFLTVKGTGQGNTDNQNNANQNMDEINNEREYFKTDLDTNVLTNTTEEETYINYLSASEAKTENIPSIDSYDTKRENSIHTLQNQDDLNSNEDDKENNYNEQQNDRIYSKNDENDFTSSRKRPRLEEKEIEPQVNGVLLSSFRNYNNESNLNINHVANSPKKLKLELTLVSPVLYNRYNNNRNKLF